ncbi:MAG: SDR family oxidoreductase [Actinobacteria bacterium]|nr:SDR family oxidoreductase [Actinomycetota bacterium]
MAANLFSLEGKNIVVVGGAGGMGSSVAKGFLEYGGTVALADISAEGLERAAKWLKDETGRDVRTYYVMATDEASVQKLVADTVADMGAVDVLVNAQGYNVKGAATEFPMEEWSKLFDINVKSVMMCCKNFGAHMVKRGRGKIINFSSIRGQRGALGGNTGYCATKGAVDMITRNIAVELAPKGICVNAVGPIITKTPMTAERIEKDAARYERFLLNVPMGRLGTTEDLVGPCVFLASAASDFITGTILYPDGGAMAFL